MAKYLIEENCYPSKFLIQREQPFPNGLGSFEEFKQTISDKLVDETVTDPDERLRQAVVILGCAAMGSFGIIPWFQFEQEGLERRGEEGARNLYNWLGSIENQINSYKDILVTKWERYKGDPGTVGVSYYAGEAAEKYMKNPRDPRWLKPQYGVSKDNIDLTDYSPDNPPRGSIRSYALKAERLFQEFKKQMPGLDDINYMAMALEKIESGGSVMYDRIQQKYQAGNKRGLLI